VKKREEILERLSSCIVEMDISGIKKTTQDIIEARIPAYTAIIEGMAKGMNIVGKKYEAGEYFLPELVMAGETMKAGMEVLKPFLAAQKAKYVGRVVIGTVAGDLHDIGKNIVAAMLESAGFEVYDLGVDVSEEEFVGKVKELKPDIMAMSALLLTTMPKMRATIEALENAGLRDRVEIIIGGRPITDDYVREVRADGYARDAVEAVKVAKRLIERRASRAKK